MFFSSSFVAVSCAVQCGHTVKGCPESVSLKNRVEAYVMFLSLSDASFQSLYLADKVEEMTHAQKASPVDMKIATIKPRPSSRCLVTTADMNV